jgi:intergrase/recombinase
MNEFNISAYIKTMQRGLAEENKQEAAGRLIPLFVHDSVMLKHIEVAAIEKILKLYSRTPKQSFIALDKEGSYTKEAQRIMKET